MTRSPTETAEGLSVAPAALLRLGDSDTWSRRPSERQAPQVHLRPPEAPRRVKRFLNFRLENLVALVYSAWKRGGRSGPVSWRCGGPSSPPGLFSSTRRPSALGDVWPAQGGPQARTVGSDSSSTPLRGSPDPALCKASGRSVLNAAAVTSA